MMGYCIYIYTYMYMDVVHHYACEQILHIIMELICMRGDSTTVFLISSYGAPLGQRASYLALHTSLFGPDGAVNYDYIITNSLCYVAQDVFSMAHTLTIVEPIWPMLQNVSKTLFYNIIHI